MEIVINEKKFWTIGSIFYIAIYSYFQYSIFVLHAFGYDGSFIAGFGIECIFNLGFCLGIPLVFSIHYLNKQYQLRDKIPIHVRFNGHEIQNLRGDKQ